jgi:glucokinase
MTKTYQPPSRTIPSRPSHLRQTNARGLLQLLQEHNPCSKADLVRYSGLSAPTVSSGIAHLESLGLVESMGDGESSGGRPPGLLRFNATHGYVAAADIGGTRLRMVLADLNGTVITQWSVLLGSDQKTPERVCSLAAEGVKVMCRQSGIPLRKILHLAAGAPGITNVATGVVLSAPNLDRWNDVSLRSLLQDAVGVPCLVENDTNLAAQGEHWRGAARGIDNFVFIALGTGVGAGIFLHGKLHHGAHWNAGEIGYFGLSGKKRLPIRMRELGQLERAIGGRGIEEEWLRVLHRTSPKATRELTQMKASQIFDLAKEGDRCAIEVVRYTAAILSDAIADISLLLNPEIIVLGGGIGSHEELCRATEKLMQRHEFAQPALRSSSLGSQAQLHGALSLSLSSVEEQLLV